MNIKSKSLSVELIFLSVETESVHLRVRGPVPDYRRLHFTAERNAHGTHTFSRRAEKRRLLINGFTFISSTITFRIAIKQTTCQKFVMHPFSLTSYLQDVILLVFLVKYRGVNRLQALDISIRQICIYC